MSQYYDDDLEQDTGTETAMGAAVGAVGGYGAHRLAKGEDYKKYEESKDASKNWKEKYNAEKARKLQNAERKVLRDHEAIKKIHEEHTVDVSEHEQSAKEAFELHEEIEGHASRQSEIEAELKELDHEIDEDGKIRHEGGEGIKEGATREDKARVEELKKEHQEVKAKREAAEGRARKAGVQGETTKEITNGLREKHTAEEARAAERVAEAEANIDKAIDERFGKRAAQARENHRVMDAQVESGYTADTVEQVKAKGRAVANAPRNAVNGTRNAVHNATEDVRAGYSKAWREHKDAAFERKTGVKVDSASASYQQEYNPHKTLTSDKATRQAQARSTAKITGEYKKPVQSKFKVKKLPRPAGGIRSTIAGLAIGAATGHVIGKMTQAPQQAAQQFDPYAAQAMAGMPVVPPYGEPVMGGFAEQIAAERAAAQGQGQSI